jgi:GrpB-like predicted nucleotidyltransferase (UPF0157 family)
MPKLAVKVKPYETGLLGIFQKEKNRLRRLLGPVGIYHVGSTAVPGLGGKNFVDILVVARSREHALQLKKALTGVGYIYRPAGSGPERIFFRKGPKSRRFHLHLTWRGTSERREKLLFRDYMRKHPAAAARYYALKLRAAKKAGGERLKYRDTKAAFIRRMIRKAKVTSLF